MCTCLKGQDLCRYSILAILSDHRPVLGLVKSCDIEDDDEDDDDDTVIKIELCIFNFSK